MSKLEILEGITLEALVAFYPQLFSSCKIEGIVLGNFTVEQAVSFGDRALSILKTKTQPNDGLVMRTTIIPPSRSIICELDVFNKEDGNSAIEYCIQFGALSHDRTRAFGQLLDQLIQEPAFNVLRTQEQLGI